MEWGDTPRFKLSENVTLANQLASQHIGGLRGGQSGHVPPPKADFGGGSAPPKILAGIY